MSLEERVAEIVRTQFDAHDREIRPDTTIRDEIDSLDLMAIILDFEAEFGISIPDEDVGRFGTVGAAIRYIEEHGGA